VVTSVQHFSRKTLQNPRVPRCGFWRHRPRYVQATLELAFGFRCQGSTSGWPAINKAHYYAADGRQTPQSGRRCVSACVPGMAPNLLDESPDTKYSQCRRLAKGQGQTREGMSGESPTQNCGMTDRN